MTGSTQVRASLGARCRTWSAGSSRRCPPGYDELNDPSVAALDFVNIDALADGTAELTTDLLQRADGSWRFRIYRRGESIPLADMLPLLDHLGLRALDERAFGFGVRRRHGVAARCRCRGAGRACS